jgi:hypothetical protein
MAKKLFSFGFLARFLVSGVFGSYTGQKINMGCLRK